ncbi:unnamed protein product [Rangifer tarandus platyrhynchus]|uniref:Uncharacterized protein n=2 Tax=Rangifer tarandus platyrhynchus TaxID=3082113 RepID=A0ABN8ZW48_RANTA|nr:unnamed protein product [Rangifer tarandus platyrhynchus]
MDPNTQGRPVFGLELTHQKEKKKLQNAQYELKILKGDQCNPSLIWSFPLKFISHMGRHLRSGHKDIFTHAEHPSSWEKSLPLIEILTGGKPCKHSSASTERRSHHHPSGLWNTVLLLFRLTRPWIPPQHSGGGAEVQ